MKNKTINYDGMELYAIGNVYSEGKSIIVYGYLWRKDDGDFEFVECRNANMPLGEFLAKSAEDRATAFSDMIDNACQFSSSYKENELPSFIKDIFGSVEPKHLSYTELTEDTPLGYYIAY